MNNHQTNFIAAAFISCSLREDDRPFIEFIEKILIAHSIKPFGTIGRYSASPTNPAELMKLNIPNADMIVVIATPRYLQKDIHTDKTSSGISEMVHVESGIAYAHNKPIVAFVQEGTNVGNFLPNVTQYMTLNGTNEDLKKKRDLIYSLLNSVYQIVVQNKSQKSSNELGNFLKTGLAVWGGIKIIEYLAEDDAPKRKPKRKVSK